MKERELPAMPNEGPIDPEVAGLTQAEATVRRAAFRSIRRGRALDASELAESTGLHIRIVEDAVDSLARRGQAVVDGAGRVVGSAGLSLVPARDRLKLEEAEFDTWCAIDAIGIPAALGVDAIASTKCPACSQSIEVNLRKGRPPDDGKLRAWLPSEDCCTSVVDEICPDMNLFCNEHHLEEWRHRAGDPLGAVLTLNETGELGRQWWRDLV